MRDEPGKPGPREPSATCERNRRRCCDNRKRIKDANAQTHIVAKKPRRGAHAHNGVVARVLQRVNRVVANRPEDRAGVDEIGGRG